MRGACQLWIAVTDWTELLKSKLICISMALLKSNSSALFYGTLTHLLAETTIYSATYKSRAVTIHTHRWLCLQGEESGIDGRPIRGPALYVLSHSRTSGWKHNTDLFNLDVLIRMFLWNFIWIETQLKWTDILSHWTIVWGTATFERWNKTLQWRPSHVELGLNHLLCTRMFCHLQEGACCTSVFRTSLNWIVCGLGCVFHIRFK